MKHSLFPAIIFSLSLVITGNAQKSQSDCDFTRYRPIIIISHALRNAEVKRVVPKYPAAARFAGTKGNVVVRILVDREGNVSQACIIEGHPLLRAAARKAALEWKFRENFGFAVKQPEKLRFIQAEIVFKYNP
jgi:TonB family protein